MKQPSLRLSLLSLPALVLVAACGGGSSGGGGAPTGPTDLDYGTAAVSLARSIQMASLTPTVTGTVDAWTVSAGALPAGVVLDAATGLISGTPSATQAATLATISATETGVGSDTFDITFTVDSAAPRAVFAIDQGNGRLASLRIEPTDGFVNHHDLEVGLDSPADLCLTPDLAYLYVCNFANGTINAYGVDPATARLTELGTSPETMVGGFGLNPSALVTSPDGGFLYVADRLAAGVSSFTIAANGDLTELAGSPSSGLTNAQDLVSLRRAGGDFLYVLATALTNQIVGFSIDGAGALTQIDTEAAGTTPVAIAATPEGDFLYALNTSAATVSGYAVGTDGLLTELAGSPFNAVAGSTTFPLDFAITSDGTSRRLYTTDNAGNVAQAAIAGDGSLSLIGVDAAPGAQYRGIVTTPDGGQVFALDVGLDELHTWSADGAGALDLHPTLSRVRMPGNYLRAAVMPSATTPTWTSDALYASIKTGNVAQLTLDGTLAMTPLVPDMVATTTDTEALAVHPEYEFVYVTNPPPDGTNSVMSIPINGDLSLDGTSLGGSAAAGAAFKLVLTPAGNHAVLLSSNGTVSPYPIGTNGALGAEGATVATGTVPLGMAIDPSGRNLYVANFGDATVSLYDVDLTSAALTPKAPATAVAGLNTRGVQVHPSGRYLYATATGAGGPGGDLIGQYLINPTTGGLVLMTPPSVGSNPDPGPMACTPDGRFLLVGSSATGTSSLDVYLINTDPGNLVNDGTLSGPISSAAIPDLAQTIQVSGDGSTVYVGSSTSATIQAYSLDGSGNLTSLDAESMGGPVRELGLRTRLE